MAEPSTNSYTERLICTDSVGGYFYAPKPKALRGERQFVQRLIYDAKVKSGIGDAVRPDHPLLFLGAKVEKIHPVMDPVLKRILLSPGQPLIITIMSNRARCSCVGDGRSLSVILCCRECLFYGNNPDIFAAIVNLAGLH